MSGRLSVEELHVRFRTNDGSVAAVNGASFELESGEIVGLVGESGCGKSVTARSLVRLEDPGEIVDGTIRFDGTDLTTADDRTLRRLRGRELATVFQDPSTALNPAYTIEEQIAESLRIHRAPDHQPLVRELATGVSSRLRAGHVREEVIDLMEAVGIPRPEERIDAYPHQFSSGMRQRAMLAIALAREPSVLIADEPTTALDTTTQAAVLDQLGELNRTYGTGMLLITHDFGIVSELCDRVLVMYDGTIVERGGVDALLADPKHPYTKALVECIPRRSERRTVLPTIDGTVPERFEPPVGCSFADRCPAATPSCRETTPETVSVSEDHTVRCDVPEAREMDAESRTAGTGDRQSGTEDAPNAELQSGTEDAPNAERHGTVDGSAETVRAGLTVDGGTVSRKSGCEPFGTSADAVVELDDVTKSFRTAEGIVDRLLGTTDRLTAVREVSLELSPGDTVGLVGESGCGKSTLVRLIAGLERPTDGTVRVDGDAVGSVEDRTTEQLAEIGVVFQNPQRSVNPRQRIGDAIAEPLREHGWQQSRRQERVEELLSVVGLPTEFTDRYPRQLSGGQIQRVAIARALALRPSVVLLDEPTSALDVSVQARILNLLQSLQDRFGLTYLFVSHDLDVVRHVADRVAVMYLGRLVEVGPAASVFSNPTHPYTRTLQESIPGNGSRSWSPRGEPPSPMTPPSGCSFHPRCPIADDECSRVDPALESIGPVRSRCLYAATLLDTEPGDAPTDSTPGDAPTDSTPGDAPTDSTPGDAPTDSTPGDAPTDSTDCTCADTVHDD